MLEISFILIMTIVLLVLEIAFFIFFIKYIKHIYISIKEIENNQMILNKKLINYKNDLAENKDEITLSKEERINIKDSRISEEELMKLMEGKELIFKKEVGVNSGDMFINTDIDI